MNIKRIAEQCNISLSAAYKAIHHKKGVDARTRQRVLAAALTMGIVPRAKVGRKPTVGVVLPCTPSYYWDALCHGLESSVPNALDAHFAFFSSMGVGRESISAIDYMENMDALIIAPPTMAEVKARIAVLAAEKPVICVSEGLDAPHLATIGGDYFKDGMRLGRALLQYQPNRKRILALHVHNGLGAQLRSAGFAKALEGSGVSIVDSITLEAISSPFASVIARSIKAKGIGSFDCLYCGTGVTPYASLALCKLGLCQDVICIGYENPPGNATYLNSGLIRLLSISDAYEMGRCAMQLAGDWLLEKKSPASPNIYVPSKIFVNQ